jgi:hypothetical protein
MHAIRACNRECPSSLHQAPQPSELGRRVSRAEFSSPLGPSVLVEEVRGVAIGVIGEVAVCVDRVLDRLMAEPRLDDGQGHALDDDPAGACVSEVVRRGCLVKSRRRGGVGEFGDGRAPNKRWNWVLRSAPPLALVKTSSSLRSGASCWSIISVRDSCIETCRRLLGALGPPIAQPPSLSLHALVTCTVYRPEASLRMSRRAAPAPH